MLAELLAQIVEQCILEGHPVELDGLGVFHPHAEQRVRFIAETVPRVFIAYVTENTRGAVQIADALEAGGMKPWLDRRKLLPGQDWHRCIERAIKRSDFFVPCFSRISSRKRGQFPYELRQALKRAEQMPLGDSFIVPVRLEDCIMPQEIASQFQYVDLFPDRESGIEVLIRSIAKEFEARRMRDRG